MTMSFWASNRSANPHFYINMLETMDGLARSCLINKYMESLDKSLQVGRSPVTVAINS
jgi:sensor histidine kinase YesM